MLLYGVPTRDSALILSSDRNRNSTRVGVNKYFLVVSSHKNISSTVLALPALIILTALSNLLE